MENIKIVVSLDKDDIESIMQKHRILAIHPNIQVFVGTPNGKIHAINRDIPDPTTFDIILLISDDMIPMVKGYDDIIVNKMATLYPDTDGVLFFNDGYAGPRLNTLVICGSAYYQRFGYIYYPEYKSLWCDNEFMNVANKLGKQTYIHDVIIKHEHPGWNKQVVMDNLYRINESFNTIDKQLYLSRNPTLYDISVLICTIPSRHAMLISLLTTIDRLIENSPMKIEVLTDASTDITTGAKRTLLLSRARGKYSCFIDDDDQITDDYFSVYEAMFHENAPNYDCATLIGMYYENGIKLNPFYHSIKYNGWTNYTNSFLRYPNHLNLIKTDICRQVFFNNVTIGEDIMFSKKLFESKLIKTEYTHDKLQYLYYKILDPLQKVGAGPLMSMNPTMSRRRRMRMGGL